MHTTMIGQQTVQKKIIELIRLRINLTTSCNSICSTLFHKSTCMLYNLENKHILKKVSRI